MPTSNALWFVGPDSEWFWAMLQFLVVAISLYFIYKQLRIQSHANMLTALFELAAKWDSDRTIEAWYQVCENHKTHPESHAINTPEERIASFFEQTALFMKKGLSLQM